MLALGQFSNMLYSNRLHVYHLSVFSTRHRSLIICLKIRSQLLL